jgi:hypothetical protein
MRPIMVAVTALTASFLLAQPAAASARTGKPAASPAALVNVTAAPRLPDGARAGSARARRRSARSGPGCGAAACG